jgi:hypothetical protein
MLSAGSLAAGLVASIAVLAVAWSAGYRRRG